MTTSSSAPSSPFALHTRETVAEGASPERWMVILHGIYGRGGNWRAFSRALVAQRPNWGCVLVDLRMHGQSQGAPPPHTLAACAQDVLRVVERMRDAGKHVHAVLGHSFGGKVALEMLRLCEDLVDVWVIDSSPGPHPDALQDPTNTVVSVLRLLQELPTQFEDRSAFVSAVTERGFARPLADWLAMNLVARGDTYHCTLEPAAMEELLASYFQADLWPVLEASARPVQVVMASKSSAVAPMEQERLRGLEKAGQVVATKIEGSHWLHVDAFEQLVAHVVSALPST